MKTKITSPHKKKNSSEEFFNIENHPLMEPSTTINTKPKNIFMKKMKWWSCITIIVLSLAIIPAFFLPLWDIYLDAPQYPEGLHMQIWTNHFSGDLPIINGLNHYIGMKQIHEEMFPELQYINTVLLIILLSGVLVGLLRFRALFAGWYFGFLAVAAYGIYDFWKWEYDYGHNLNPHAAIQIPGMSYQPPLIFGKQLLNFYAWSFPASGGLIVMSAGTVAFLLFVYEIFLRKKIHRLK